MANACSVPPRFLSGYTSKTPGTEDGITEPSPTFSTCERDPFMFSPSKCLLALFVFNPGFGQPFLVLHPSRYASMLAQRMTASGTKCWVRSLPAPRTFLDTNAVSLSSSSTVCYLFLSNIFPGLTLRFFPAGWTGGKFGVGKRCPLKHTRAIVDAYARISPLACLPGD